MNIKNKGRLCEILAICLVVLSVGIGVFLMLRGSETYTSSSSPDSIVGALICKTSSSTGSFFEVEKTLSSSHEIRITYRQDDLSGISYSYTGVFNDEKNAESASTHAHVAYNEYMSKRNLKTDNISNSFIASNTVFRMNLYTAFNKLDNEIAALFFLSEEGDDGLMVKTIQDLKTIYENKNFSCIINDN